MGQIFNFFPLSVLKSKIELSKEQKKNARRNSSNGKKKYKY